jgi:peptidoglycan hydrolase CwlO-like protein
MKNPKNEKEKLFKNVIFLKEKIDDIKEYLDSYQCQQCSKLYTKLFKYQQELLDLEKTINECS